MCVSQTSARNQTFIISTEEGQSPPAPTRSWSHSKPVNLQNASSSALFGPAERVFAENRRKHLRRDITEDIRRLRRWRRPTQGGNQAPTPVAPRRNPGTTAVHFTSRAMPTETASKVQQSGLFVNVTMTTKKRKRPRKVQLQGRPGAEPGQSECPHWDSFLGPAAEIPPQLDRPPGDPAGTGF